MCWLSVLLVTPISMWPVFGMSFPWQEFSIESKHEVTILSGLNEFVVKFHGPPGSMCNLLLMRFYFLILFYSHCNTVGLCVKISFKSPHIRHHHFCEIWSSNQWVIDLFLFWWQIITEIALDQKSITKKGHGLEQQP